MPVIAGIASYVGLTQVQTGHYPVSTGILFTIFLTAGGIMLYAVAGDILINLWRYVKKQNVDRDYIFLAGWLIAVMGVVVILLPHATAKYTLPFLPPLVLILFKELEGLRLKRLAKWLAIAAFGLTLITATIVSAADYTLAQSSRDFVSNFSERYGATGTVWFVGEWGFRHYMEAQDYRYLSSADESPAPGDIIVRAEFSDWPLAGGLRDRMQLIETSRAGWKVPVRVMNFDAGAGFYGTYWGGLPFAISSEPVEKFEVFRVS